MYFSNNLSCFLPHLIKPLLSHGSQIYCLYRIETSFSGKCVSTIIDSRPMNELYLSFAFDNTFSSDQSVFCRACRSFIIFWSEICLLTIIFLVLFLASMSSTMSKTRKVITDITQHDATALFTTQVIAY